MPIMNRSSAGRRGQAVTRKVLLVLASAGVPFLSSSQNAPAQANPTNEKSDAAVHAFMRNVRFRFSDNVSVRIRSLTGALVPAGDHAFPVSDDKHSFKLRIDTGEIVILPADLANVLNSYVFARPNAPLSGISIAIEKGQLKIKGRLRDKGNIPFETIGTLSTTPDGRVRLHSNKIKALRIPVTGLMSAFGVEVEDLIKTGKVPGVQVEENDLILDLQLILPAPHIQGAVTAIGIEGNGILTTFGSASGPAIDAQSTEKYPSGNIMALQGNRLRFGKLTMDDTDIIVVDMDVADPLDFYLDHYKEQLAAGYTKISTNFQLRVFIKDYSKLSRAPAAKKKSN
jgi:hypothetical protein